MARARHPLAGPAAALLLAAALLPACTEAPPAVAVVVRDSAGVTIVEHAAGSLEAAPRWSLAATPRLRIGTVTGDEALQLDDVRDATRLPDGAIAVLDRSRTLRRFDAQGTPRWTAGRDGAGPGEFRAPVLVETMAGDSLVVWDGATSRLSVFSGDGQFVRTAPLRHEGSGTRAWGTAADGSILVGSLSFERKRIDGHEALEHPVDLYLVALDGTIARELGRRPYVTNFQEVDENGAFSPAIFGMEALVGPSAAGLWFGDTREYELREETGPGAVRRIVRWRGPDRTVTDADVEALLARWIDEAEQPSIKQYLARYGETHPRADRFPAYEQLHVDDAGRLWLRDYVREHADDGQRRWTIFSADGTAILARLAHPASLEIHDAGEDWVLAVEKDELDVESVVVYAIVR